MRKALSAFLAATLVAGPVAAETTIKIGVLTDMAGPYSDFVGAGSVAAAKMAVEDFSAASKGVRVEVVFADHQNKPDIAASIARQWYDRDGIDVIADMPQSAAALAVNGITKEKNKILLVASAATSDLTGKACSPNTIHWTYDTWSLAHGTGSAMVKSGGDSWFFLTADFAFGHALERDTTAVVESGGGKVVGRARHPAGTRDFAAFLLEAQASRAKVIGLANAGADTINAIKQAAEFGITKRGQTLAGLLVFLSDVHSLGTPVAQGLVLTESFYWDLNDQTRAWSRRFAEKREGRMPTMVHAGVYASILHYLKSVEATGSKDSARVMAKMKEMPTDDPLFGKGHIRIDGRKVHDMYLFRVKKPDQSKGPWDLYEQVATIPADVATRPLSEGGCYLAK
jgi:branched-chain amino acid transport system substrate-binding protein